MVVIGDDFGGGAAVGDFEDCIPAVGVRLVGGEDAEVPRFGVELHDVAEVVAHDARGLGIHKARRGDAEGVVTELREHQVFQEKATVGVGVSAHTRCAFWRSFRKFRVKFSALVEEFFRLVAAEPVFEHLQFVRVFARAVSGT